MSKWKLLLRSIHQYDVSRKNFKTFHPSLILGSAKYGPKEKNTCHVTSYKNLVIWLKGIPFHHLIWGRTLNSSKFFSWGEWSIWCRFEGNMFNPPRADSPWNLRDLKFIPVNLWHWDEKKDKNMKLIIWYYVINCMILID